MGTFMGHVLPGSFFILFSLWWTVNVFRRYYDSLLSNGRKFRSSATYSCACVPRRFRHRIDIEGLLKIALCAVGVTGEVITGFDDQWRWAHMGNGQHSTMFCLFILSGVVDVLLGLGAPLPPGIEYLVGVCAFSVEGVLFMFHLEGRQGLDVLLHTLLVYTIGATVVATLIELRHRQSVLASLSRVYCVLLQGTWFLQVGWILYPPLGSTHPHTDIQRQANATGTLPGGEDGSNGAINHVSDHMGDHSGGHMGDMHEPWQSSWQQNDHTEKLLATMMFTWHMAGVLLVMLSIGGFIGWFYRCRHGPFALFSDPYSALEMHLIQKNQNGHTVINMHEDSESDDVEYERPLIDRNAKANKENGLR